MKTNKDYTVNFMGYGEITIPKGTRVTNMTAMGEDKNYHFIDDLSWIERNYKTVAGILRHDATYHGIDVPKEYIDF